MKRKEIELEIKKIKEVLNDLLSLSSEMNLDMLTIDEAKKRDYIVRTKGIGKMKDKKLIEDFKKEFKDYNDIENYKFDNLDKYYTLLKLYEQKQIVIDVYGTKA